MTTKIINLLNINKAKTPIAPIINIQNESTSVVNVQYGICPKCNKSMSSATIVNDESVYYCESCRVAIPKPNAA
jgi:predicted  nucleic acid-binding Zn ribbon protein